MSNDQPEMPVRRSLGEGGSNGQCPARKIVKARRMAGLTQAELARRPGRRSRTIQLQS